MPKPRISKVPIGWTHKVRDGMSPRHLEDVRALPCVICGAPAPSDPHHLMRAESGSRGIGMRAADKWAIPVCRPHHDEIQPSEEAKLAEYGIDGRALAQALWTVRGDRKAMLRIVSRTRQRAELERRGIYFAMTL